MFWRQITSNLIFKACAVMHHFIVVCALECGNCYRMRRKTNWFWWEIIGDCGLYTRVNIFMLFSVSSSRVWKNSISTEIQNLLSVIIFMILFCLWREILGTKIAQFLWCNKIIFYHPDYLSQAIIKCRNFLFKKILWIKAI